MPSGKKKKLTQNEQFVKKVVHINEIQSIIRKQNSDK